jgi:hypothetical protein
MICDDLGNHLLDGHALCNVGLMQGGVPSQVVNGRGSGVRMFIQCKVIDGHIGACMGQGQGDAAPNTSGSTRHQGNLPGQGITGQDTYRCVGHSASFLTTLSPG